MGLNERDYVRRRPPSGVGAVRLWSVTTWLIVINVAVFVVDTLMQRATAHETPWGEVVMGDSLLMQWGSFSIGDLIFRGQVWRLITCQFLHIGIWHLVVNMFGLWMFGPVVELNLGSRRYAFFYFLCGIAGPLTYTLLWGLGILLPEGRGILPELMTPMVGASAGIFGVLLAAAYLSPDRLIYIYFIELPLKVFAWIMMAIAAYTVLTNGGNAGGEAAHLGGGLLGWILIRHEQVLDLAARKKFVRGRRVKDWARDFNR
jgi:membrane associated rhomboid family serine protease